MSATRYIVTSQPEAPLRARAIKLGWQEGESLWDYLDIAEGEERETFKSQALAFAAARKAARSCVWGAAQLWEQEAMKADAPDWQWCDVAKWEVQPGDKRLGAPMNVYEAA